MEKINNQRMDKMNNQRMDKINSQTMEKIKRNLPKYLLTQEKIRKTQWATLSVTSHY